MCAIFGAFGRPLRVSTKILDALRRNAADRGRDGGNMVRFPLSGGYTGYLGAWRATPTTETKAAPPQPYGGIVHNGTIANDRELGNPEGAVDSMILQHVLDRSSLEALVTSLGRIKGSYALGIAGTDTIYLATTYKPVHFVDIDGAIYFASMERHLAPLLSWTRRAARLPPYSATSLRTGQIIPLQRPHNRRALVVCSGGLDSTTAAYMLRDQGYDVTLLHFDYGCRATSRERERVHQIALSMNAECIVLPLDYSKFTGNSPLLTEGAIADGIAGAEFAHEWVPARNLLMLANTVAYAEANDYSTIALGNNLEEAGAYPDNEEEFTHLLDMVLDYAVHDGGQVRIVSPVGHLMKHEIVAAGMKLGVPYRLTWSCYRGGATHCGRCGPCVMRSIAFERNGYKDPVFAEAA